MPIREPLLILTGPTASGKSAVAVEAAERAGAAILSADSQQVYRGMAIGTAQPTAEEERRVPHHLVGYIEPGEPCHVARFVHDAEAVLEAEAGRGRPVIICGGTGLFLRHLVEGIFAGAPRDPAVRDRLEAEWRAGGLEPLRERLRLVDPVREAEINPNDAMRVIRALEVFETTGAPMSEHHRRDAVARRVRQAIYVVVHRPRPILRERINRRVDVMLRDGWLEEARALLDRGLPPDTQAFKAHGYRELFRVLRGEMRLDEAADEIRRQVRRYSKRQLTWFRAVKGARWLDLEGMGTPEAACRVLELFGLSELGGNPPEAGQ